MAAIDALPDLSHDNLKVEIENLLAALSRQAMNVLAVDVTHAKLGIPAFYTIIPGAHFRERAEGGSVGMFCAKLITENNPAPLAVMALKEVETQMPDKYYVQFYLGTAHLEMGDADAALACLGRALDLDPAPQDIPSIYSYMGVCLKDLERYREALAVLERGLRLDPDRTDLYNLKGFCHFKLREHEAAIESFKAVLRINPGSAIDYANIASNYRDMGNTEKAVFYYQMALSIDPSIDFARDNLEKLMAGQKRSR
jgi:ribosomal protein S12 methylthiotransferase accessory factor